jgi:hypothetical protein
MPACHEDEETDEVYLFSGFCGLRIDDIALSWKFFAGNVLRISRQRGFSNIIAGGAAGVIRIDRRVGMHGMALKNSVGRS